MSDTATASHVALTPEQIAKLEQQGCTVEGSDWTRVQVASGFVAERVRQVHFAGQIRIGRLDGTCPTAPDAMPGLDHATLADCTLGDNVRVANVGVRIANYSIEAGASVENVGRMETTADATFGNGIQVDAVNEGGGRGAIMFNELSSQLADLMCMHRHRRQLQVKLAELARTAAARARRGRGTVAAGARVESVPEIINVHIGPAATVRAATSLREGSILSDPAAPTTIGAGVQAREFIVAEGCEVARRALLLRTYVGQGCHMGRQFSAENCLFFANCEAFHGEACSVLAGPYTVTHHKSTLLIAGMFSFYNAGSGSNQSNHMYKLGPNHEGKLERGCKTGSFSYMMWPCRVGPFSLVLGKHSRAFDTADFPFSLLDATPDGRCALIPGLTLSTVGTVRDGAKWPRRDRREGPVKRDRISFDILSPLTVGRMLRGSAILHQLQQTTDKSVDTVSVNGAEIKRVLLRTGQKYYRRGINLYLSEKIIARVEAAIQRGAATLQEALATSPDAVYSEDWLDIGGQLMPRQRLLDLCQDVEEGRIADVETLHQRLDEIHAAHAEDEWLWVRHALQRQTGLDLGQATVENLREVAQTLHKTRKEFLQLVLIDASKEFDELSQIGFGVDRESQRADFQAVRGEYDANEFVTRLKQEIDQLEPFVQEFNDRLNSLG